MPLVVARGENRKSERHAGLICHTWQTHPAKQCPLELTCQLRQKKANERGRTSVPPPPFRCLIHPGRHGFQPTQGEELHWPLCLLCADSRVASWGLKRPVHLWQSPDNSNFLNSNLAHPTQHVGFSQHPLSIFSDTQPYRADHNDPAACMPSSAGL